jgi:hypothetical protein
MMKYRSLCALLLCGGIAASAGAAPRELSTAALDAITAGASPSASVGALAGATGDFTITNTTTNALVLADNSVSNNPAATGYVAVSAGVATATGLGNGAGTTTSVTPSASVPGSNVVTYTINHHVQSGGTEITASAVAKFGTYAAPLSLLK